MARECHICGKFVYAWTGDDKDCCYCESGWEKKCEACPHDPNKYECIEDCGSGHRDTCLLPRGRYEKFMKNKT